MELNNENFESTISENKMVFVKFYAPWCGHCKAMHDDYVNIAKKGLKDVIIAAINLNEPENNEISKKYNVDS